MREILFRGKRIDNGEWVQGYPCRYGWIGKEKDYIIPDYPIMQVHYIQPKLTLKQSVSTQALSTNTA